MELRYNLKVASFTQVTSIYRQHRLLNKYATPYLLVLNKTGFAGEMPYRLHEDTQQSVPASPLRASFTSKHGMFLHISDAYNQ